MAHTIEEAIDLVVAQGRAVLIGLELRGQAKVRQRPAHGTEHSSMEARVPDPGLPTLKRLPLKSLKLRDVGPLRLSTVKGSGCREKTARRSVNFPSLANACAVHGVVLPVGLGHTEVQFTLANGIDVDHRTARRFHRAANAMARTSPC